ncbi:Protein FAR1-RELATED SEQUENCE 5 [Linum perenne]
MDSDGGGDDVTSPSSDGNTDPISGDDGAVSGPDLNRIESSDPVVRLEEPYVGMEFDTEAESVEYYSAYAQRMGFGLRVRDHLRGREGFIVRRTMVCTKEGYKKEKRSQRKTPSKRQLGLPRPDPLRIGCKAKMGFKRLASGKWAVKSFVKEHNHPLSSNEGSQCPRVLEIPADDKRVRELTEELIAERKRSASLRQFVQVLLNHIEEHTQGLSQKVQCMVQKVNQIDDSQQEEQQ